MSTAAASARLEAPSAYDWDTFFAALGDVPATRDTVTVKRKSRDYFWYSPVLNEQLNGKFADVVVTPRDEAEVIRVAAACAKAPHPARRRAARGTGNYGQAVPLEGGVLLDMAALDAIEWQQARASCACGPGVKMHDLDAATRPNGFELRMHPSTKRTGDDRRLRRRRLGRRRLGDLWRPARARQHPRGARRDAGGDSRACSSCAPTPRRRSTAPTAPPASSRRWKCRSRRPGRGST